MNPHLFIKVRSAKYIDQYKLLVTFSGNIKKVVNFEKHLKGKIFEPLINLEYFKKFTVNKDTHTINWPNEADFSPDFLFKVGKKI
jgi:hypothetical protein